MPRTESEFFEYQATPDNEFAGFFSFFLFNWDSLYARLNSHYEAWSYNKRSTKKITGYIKSV